MPPKSDNSSSTANQQLTRRPTTSANNTLLPATVAGQRREVDQWTRDRGAPSARIVEMALAVGRHFDACGKLPESLTYKTTAVACQQQLLSESEVGEEGGAVNPTTAASLATCFYELGITLDSMSSKRDALLLFNRTLDHLRGVYGLGDLSLASQIGELSVESLQQSSSSATTAPDKNYVSLVTTLATIGALQFAVTLDERRRSPYFFSIVLHHSFTRLGMLAHMLTRSTAEQRAAAAGSEQQQQQQQQSKQQFHAGFIKDALALSSSGDDAFARPLACMRKAVELARWLAASQQQHPLLYTLATSLALYGDALAAINRIDEALPLLQEAVALLRQLLQGNELAVDAGAQRAHARVGFALINLAAAQLRAGKTTEARDAAIEANVVLNRVYYQPELLDHPQRLRQEQRMLTTAARDNEPSHDGQPLRVELTQACLTAAVALHAAGQPDRALPFARDALDAYRIMEMTMTTPGASPGVPAPINTSNNLSRMPVDERWALFSRILGVYGATTSFLAHREAEVVAVMTEALDLTRARHTKLTQRRQQLEELAKQSAATSSSSSSAAPTSSTSSSSASAKTDTPEERAAALAAAVGVASHATIDLVYAQNNLGLAQVTTLQQQAPAIGVALAGLKSLRDAARTALELPDHAAMPLRYLAARAAGQVPALDAAARESATEMRKLRAITATNLRLALERIQSAAPASLADADGAELRRDVMRVLETSTKSTTTVSSPPIVVARPEQVQHLNICVALTKQSDSNAAQAGASDVHPELDAIRKSLTAAQGSGSGAAAPGAKTMDNINAKLQSDVALFLPALTSELVHPFLWHHDPTLASAVAKPGAARRGGPTTAAATAATSAGKSQRRPVESLFLLAPNTEVLKHIDAPTEIFVRYRVQGNQRPDKVAKLIEHAYMADRHPNILMALLAIKHRDGSAEVDLEFADAGPLMVFLPKFDPVSRVTVALCITRQILDAMLYMVTVHGKLHRNINPRTVLLRRDGCVKLDLFDNLDPQTCRDNADIYFTNEMPYCAPECRDANGSPDKLLRWAAPTADVWSVGVLIVAMVWGLPLRPRDKPSRRGAPSTFVVTDDDRTAFAREKRRFELLVAANNLDVPDVQARIAGVDGVATTAAQADEMWRTEISDPALRYLARRALRVHPPHRITLDEMLATTYVLGGVTPSPTPAATSAAAAPAAASAISYPDMAVHREPTRVTDLAAVATAVTFTPVNPLTAAPCEFAQSGCEHGATGQTLPLTTTHLVTVDRSNAKSVVFAVQRPSSFADSPRQSFAPTWSCDENSLAKTAGSISTGAAIYRHLTKPHDYLVAVGNENPMVFDHTRLVRDKVRDSLVDELKGWRRARQDTARSAAVDKAMREVVKQRTAPAWKELAAAVEVARLRNREQLAAARSAASAVVAAASFSHDNNIGSPLSVHANSSSSAAAADNFDIRGSSSSAAAAHVRFFLPSPVVASSAAAAAASQDHNTTTAPNTP